MKYNWGGNYFFKNGVSITKGQYGMGISG